MMWLVFDQLWWSAPAAVQMKRTFISTLRSLAQFAREPVSKDTRVAVDRSLSLRETINKNFDKVRSVGDAVLFEFGPSRHQDLAVRDRIRQWQPQLRVLFLTRIALLKYRLKFPGFELPPSVASAQEEFDEELAKTLDAMADRLEGKPAERDYQFEAASKRLDETIETQRAEELEPALAAELQTFVALSRRVENLTTSLDAEI